VQIAHLKLSGIDNWGGAGRMLEEIAAARRRGLPVDCDAYPYDTATNPLRNLLPRWVIEGGIAAMLERLARREVRARIRAEIERDGLNNFGRIPSWDVVRIAVAPNLPHEAGRTLGEIARRRGVDPLDGVCDFLITDRGETRILIRSMSEADVREIIGSSWVWSDPTPTRSPPRADEPRQAAPTLVRDARPLARPFRPRPRRPDAARGHSLRPPAPPPPRSAHGPRRAPRGAWADVVVFDPARIGDLATYDDPHRYSVGVSTWSSMVRWSWTEATTPARSPGAGSGAPVDRIGILLLTCRNPVR